MRESHPPSIVVDQVTKRFARSTVRGDLRERFARQVRGEKQPSGAFLALDSVSFTVQPGQPVGIIGHNGSGKSTLLKLLTGILKPTSGSITVNGRVGALIEVGAGFHPDLSGRENVYLAGSILGLSRQQVHTRYDQIVDFAGLADFMETPVKRYSSGMYMRLGFAIVAHLDPEILLVDEVLAVGDAFFQNKCLRFLKEFVKQGGTVAFVSHALDSVQLLCETCVWLDHGKAAFIGPTEEAISRYNAVVAEREDAEFARLYPVEWEAQQAEKRRLEEEEKREEERLQREDEEARQREQEAARWEEEKRLATLRKAEREAQRQAEKAHRAAEKAERERLAREEANQRRATDPSLSSLRDTRLYRASGIPTTALQAGESVGVEIDYWLPEARANLIIGFEIYRDDGLYLFAASNYQYALTVPASKGAGTLTFTLPFLGINAGTYRLRLSLFPEPNFPEWGSSPEHVLESAVAFSVSAGALAHGCAFLDIRDWRIKP